MADAVKGQFISRLNKYDVLCGRGSGPNERMGNINFRDLVSTRKIEYLAINPRDHKNKNRIAREIVAVVRSRGGRFLKRAAGVEIADGDPEVYELADETAVLEKAKQALRQNRVVRTMMTGSSSSSSNSGNVADSGRQSNMMEGVTHLPVHPNQHQAFAAALQQQDNYGASPAEVAIRNLQMQNFAAQQERNIALQANSMLGHNPHFPLAGGGVDLDHYRNAIAMQQYKSMQQYSIPNATRSGQPNDLSATSALDSEYIRYHLEQQIMNQNFQDMSRFGGHTPSLPQRKEPYEYPLSSLNTKTGDSVSDSQMKTLESIFASTSQSHSMPHVRCSVDSRMQHNPQVRSSDSRRGSVDSRRISVDSRAQHNPHAAARQSSEPFIDGLEDMSLPSMSIGEISDFSAQGASLSRSKRSVGGTIVGDGIIEDYPVSDAVDHAVRPQDVTGSHFLLSQLMATEREYTADRHVTFLGRASSSPRHESPVAMAPPMPSNNADLQIMMAQQAHAAARLNATNPPRRTESSDSVTSRRTESSDSVTSAAQKKQRRSLSNYYREVRAAHDQSQAGGHMMEESMDETASDRRRR